MDEIDRDARTASVSGDGTAPATNARPTPAQMRYLRLGLRQPGGKLPLFDADGREIDPRTIRSCIERGWAKPWFDNPIRRDWLVCRLTEFGRQVAGS